jgi:hypothetical protein
MSLSQITGAAFITLLVNVPAVTQGAVLKINAISLRPLYLIPASVPAAINPLAAVTPPSICLIVLIYFLFSAFCKDAYYSFSSISLQPYSILPHIAGQF